VINLRLSTYEPLPLGVGACEYMRNLGITYKKAIPQSLGDQWWFLDCESVPKNLPSTFSIINQSAIDEWLGCNGKGIDYE
jgi:hypothetical protein